MSNLKASMVSGMMVQVPVSLLATLPKVNTDKTDRMPVSGRYSFDTLSLPLSADEFERAWSGLRSL